MAPRSAVKVTRTLEQGMQMRQQRALDLEHQLQQASGKNGKNVDEVAANRVRVPLCEVLADMMLTDPATAVKLDVDNRLWRHCFYSRIVPLRTKFQKAKKRNKPETPQIEEALNKFLSEAVTLYKYMADNLQAKLQGQSLSQMMSPSQSQFSQSQDDSVGSNLLSPIQQPLTSTAGIVELLHRIYIRLGDLFRYTSTQLEQAEKSYTTAATLGFGHGHAYNQIAVVCQTKEDSATTIALYWYARSILSTSEPFDTSRSNLQRLFNDNLEWLQQQRPEVSSSQQPMLSQQPTTLSGALKPIQTKHFLSEFVDLHRLFFQRQDSTTLYKALDKVMEKFGSLLAVSAFGDNLLIKLISIHAFSECNCQTNKSTTSSKRSGGGGNQLLFGWAARTATYHLGIKMADKILSLALQRQKQAASHGKPSLRLLLPFLLVSEFVVSICYVEHGVGISTKAQQRHDEARQSFWERAVQVWNYVKTHFSTVGSAAADSVVEQPKEYKALAGFVPFSAFVLVGDSENEKQGFVSDEEAIACVTAPAANNNQSQQPNKSQSQQPSLSQQQPAAITLARRIVRVAHQVTAQSPHICYNDGTGLWEWKRDGGHHQQQQQSQQATQKTHNTSLPVDDPMEVEKEPQSEALWLPPPTPPQEQPPALKVPKEAPPQRTILAHKETPVAKTLTPVNQTPASSTLVYQAGPDGSPALLVPGALLGTTPAPAPPKPPPPGPPVEMDHILGTVPAAEKPAVPAAPPGLSPPPGFGGFGTPSATTVLANAPKTAVTPGLPNAPTESVGAPSLFGTDHSAPAVDSLLFSGGGLVGSSTDSGNLLGTASSLLGGPTVGQVLGSLDQGDDMVTSNPFVETTTAPLNKEPLQQQPALAANNAFAFLGQQPQVSGDTSLLNSGLLQSLWTTDAASATTTTAAKPPTNNPFAI